MDNKKQRKEIKPPYSELARRIGQDPAVFFQRMRPDYTYQLTPEIARAALAEMKTLRADFKKALDQLEKPLKKYLAEINKNDERKNN
jgi:hypothetical protein